MKKYLEKNRSRLLLIGLFVFLVHSAKLNSGIIGIDTEDLLHLQNDFYGGWLHTGRQGLVFLKYVFGNMQYNPYFSGAATLLLFSLAVSAFFLLWDKAGGNQESILAWGCGGLLWISHPAMAEQFYFSLQSMEICMAIALTALALYLSFRWVGGHPGIYAVGSVFILVVAFSVYQTFVVMYIFGTVALLLFQSLKEASEGTNVRGKVIFRRVFLYCSLFLGGYLLNTLITRIFFSSSSYLENQIYWGRASVKDCLHAIAGHVVKVFTGYASIFYNAGFGVLALVDLVLLLWFLSNAKGRKKRSVGVVVFFYLALLSTPFLMSILLGGTPAMRSQLVLPAATGFLGYLGIRLLGLQKGKFQKGWQFHAALGCMAAIALVSGMEQAKVTGSLYYTDSCRYEQDAALGRAIIERIEQINQESPGEALPVIMIGGREFSGNNSCVTGEVIGRSFFNYDRDVEPVSFWSTRRALGFLHTLGADYIQVPREWVGDAVAYSADMPVWPAEGSVQVKGNMIIVKLSED